MNKKILSALLMGAFFIASTSMFVSCKDYDDDIKNLQAQIDKNTAAINAIQTKINEGGILESVTKTDNGIRIVINGQSYDITNGQDGAPGTPGTVWTIVDGYWAKDGVKTEYKAIGQDGATPTVEIKDGYWYINNKNTGVKATGNDGVTPTVEIKGGYWYINGVNTGVKAEGQPGTTTTVVTGVKYYVPNPETNTFWVYNDGDKDPYDSGISYVTGGEGPISGITAVKTDDYLYLYGVEGGEGALKLVTISLSADLKGLVFVPHLYLDGIESIEYPWIGDTIHRWHSIPVDWINISHHTAEKAPEVDEETRQDIAFPDGTSYTSLSSDIKKYTRQGDFYPNSLGRHLMYDKKSTGNKIIRKYVRKAADADPDHYIFWFEPSWGADEWIYGPAWEVEYHLNPSSAQVDYASNAPAFNVLEPDVVYYNTRAAASQLGVSSPEEFFKIYKQKSWRTALATPNKQIFRKDGSGIVYVGLQIAHPDRLAPWPTDETINPNGNTDSSISYPEAGHEQNTGNLSGTQVTSGPYANNDQYNGDINKYFEGDAQYGAWYGWTRYAYIKNNTDNTIALQMKTAADEKVTSDYALLVPTHVQLEGLIWDKKPMYKEPKINHFKGGDESRIGDEEGWALDEKHNCYENRIHIWDTPQEALADPDGAALELMCEDPEGIDLRPYLGVHYLRENLKKRELIPGIYNPKAYDLDVLHYGDEAAWGLHYEFELVDYQNSTNGTRDSRYASFKSWCEGMEVGTDKRIDGWNMTTDQTGVIIAKSVDNDGYPINTRSTVSVDREPLVRVMLKNEAGDVLLDGYILLHINYTPLNKSVAYDEETYTFNLCDPITHFTTWAQFSKWILQDALQGRYVVDPRVDNTGMEILAFDDYFWAVCKEGSEEVDKNDKKYVTPMAYQVTVPGIEDAHMRGYELKLYNFGKDIYGTDSKAPETGFATAETSNAFENDDLGNAVYYPNGEGTTNHIFSWTLSEEEIEYLTHDKPEALTTGVKVNRWICFAAKDVAYDYAHRDRDVNNYSSPYPYLWVKLTLNLKRQAWAYKYSEKNNNYWFNYQNGYGESFNHQGWSGVIFDIMAPGNAAVPTIKDERWTNQMSSTLITNKFVITNTEKKNATNDPYCGHAKYFFAPKNYKITAKTMIDGYKIAGNQCLAEYIITPQNGDAAAMTTTDSKAYVELPTAQSRVFGIPASLDGKVHNYRNVDTWNMLFCKYVPEKTSSYSLTEFGSSFSKRGDYRNGTKWGEYADNNINQNPDFGYKHWQSGKTETINGNQQNKGGMRQIAPDKYVNMKLNNSEWWNNDHMGSPKHTYKTPTDVEFHKHIVDIKDTHMGHIWDPSYAQASVKTDADLKAVMQQCAIKYNDGVFNDTILYAKNVKTGEYTPIAKFVKYEQYSKDASTYTKAGSFELIHWLPIGATAEDAEAGRAIENLVAYDVLNALGYPTKVDGSCDFDHAREFINKQLRAWVGVVANNGCDVALYVEQEKHDDYSEALDKALQSGHEKENGGNGTNGEIWQKYCAATGLTPYIAAPADPHKYTPSATFIASWERPINLDMTEIPAALDANTGENTIYLLDYLKLYDWRGDKNRQGYMYSDHWWFWGYYNVKGIAVDLTPSNIWTNMHQTSKDTFKKMSEISTQVRLFVGEPYMRQQYGLFGIGWNAAGKKVSGPIGNGTSFNAADDWKLWQFVPATQEAAIEQYMGITPRNVNKLAKFGSIYYENNGDNVTEFDVLIPITIFYEWGSQKYCTKWHIDTTHGRTTPLTK